MPPPQHRADTSTCVYHGGCTFPSVRPLLRPQRWLRRGPIPTAACGPIRHRERSPHNPVCGRRWRRGGAPPTSQTTSPPLHFVGRWRASQSARACPGCAWVHPQSRSPGGPDGPGSVQRCYRRMWLRLRCGRGLPKSLAALVPPRHSLGRCPAAAVLGQRGRTPAAYRLL